MNFDKWVVCCTGGVLVCLGCLGFMAPLMAACELVLGWVFFLGRTLPRLTVNWAGVATAAVCLVAGGVGLHFFARWLYQAKAGQEETEAVARRWRPRWTVAVVAVVVLMFVAGTAAVGLTHQTVWLFTSPEPLTGRGSLREAAARTISTTNLKQMAVAASTYHDVHKHFPPGGVFDEHGRALHGWQTLLLPYVEQKELYNGINLKLPWSDPANAAAFRTRVPMYQCHDVEEKDDPEGMAPSHYAGNVRVLGGVRLTLKDITDGTSNTLFAGEAAGNFKPWGHPRNWRDPARGLNKSADGFGSPSGRDQVIFAMMDGSVRYLHKDISPAVLRALSTPNGGETLPDDWDR
jgi:hypothetical protein